MNPFYECYNSFSRPQQVATLIQHSQELPKGVSAHPFVYSVYKWLCQLANPHNLKWNPRVTATFRLLRSNIASWSGWDHGLLWRASFQWMLNRGNCVGSQIIWTLTVLTPLLEYRLSPCVTTTIILFYHFLTSFFDIWFYFIHHSFVPLSDKAC